MKKNMKKNIIITGGSKGLGLEIVKKLNSKYNIYNISRTPVNIKGIKNIYYDLSKIDGLEAYLKNCKILKKVKINGLILNSGYAYDDLITNMKLKKAKFMINVNLISNFILTKFFIRNALLYNADLSIIFISSISAMTGYKGLSMYSATKGALNSFSKTISREWGKFNIRSNAIVPGFMETNMTQSLSEDKKKQIYKRNSIDGPTQPISVIATIEYLLSDKSKSVTGQNIVVDNGSI